MPNYRMSRRMVRRVAPFPADFGLALPATLAAEGHYLEYDYRLSLLPENPLPPTVLSAFRFAANPGFAPGEVIRGYAAPAGPGDVQELTFSTPPDPPLVRGEVVTDAGMPGATARVARRYSDDRYLVYDVVGGWSAGGPVTGSVGAGGTTPGVVSLAVSITAVFDSTHWKDQTVQLMRQIMGVFPPGSTVQGATSGAAATIVAADPPRATLELSSLYSQIDTVDDPQGIQFKTCVLYGDLALLGYDLGAVADYGQRRFLRGEMFYQRNQPHAPQTDTNITWDLGLIKVEGYWGGVVPIPNPADPAGIVARDFRDGILVRCYPMYEKAGAVLANPAFTRQLTYNEHWLFQERIG